MRTSDFDYDLPEERIAQRPARPRDASRLLVLDRQSGEIEHRRFSDLPAHLKPSDVIVLNETRVIPARLPARKIPAGGKAEILLLKRLKPAEWEAMVGGKGLRAGKSLRLANGVRATILRDLTGPRRIVQFSEPIWGRLEEIGETPLPPYIHKPVEDPGEYQTVFARLAGSSAAPTAGLHFTPELLARIRSMGVRMVRVNLHIGLDTFAPVNEEDPRAHPIHREWCQVTPRAAETIRAAAAAGSRIIAVGTTTVRTLETAARVRSDEAISAFEGATDLFILPGFDFKIVDALITNFHLPRSTLLMLVSAFASREMILRTYKQAIKLGYRFYSFGDAMLIK